VKPIIVLLEIILENVSDLYSDKAKQKRFWGWWANRNRRRL